MKHTIDNPLVLTPEDYEGRYTPVSLTEYKHQFVSKEIAEGLYKALERCIDRIEVNYMKVTYDTKEDHDRFTNEARLELQKAKQG